MESLNRNWLTEHHIDFEYKKYILLAYLQHVSDHFTENRLYPFLSDLVEHYRNLKFLKESKQQLFDRFPERILGSDAEHFRLVYQKIIEDDSLMKEIEQIVDEAHHMGAGGMDVLQIVLVTLVPHGAETLLHDDLGEAKDRIEGRADLVADLGEEV